MLYIIKYVYGFLIPPGLFITVLLLFSFWLRRRDRGAAKLLWAVIMFIWIFTSPLAGNLLISYLEQKYEPPVAVQGDVIVMLGGGAVGGSPDIDGKGNVTGTTMNRITAAYKLHKNTNLPVLLSGGQVFKDSGNEAQISKRTLLALGVAESSLIVEDQSRNTEENASYTLQILKQRNFTKPVLITSAFHMPRSVEQFKQLGINVTPYPTDFLVPRPYSVTLNSLLPSSDGLQKSSWAAKEYLGLLQALF